MGWFRKRSAIDEQAMLTELAELRAEIDELRARLAQPPVQPTVTTPPPPVPGMSLSDLDQRITNTTSELARQLDELSHELSALDEMKTAQERLAAEQVRYDLALRAELAAIADETRRRQR